MVETNYEKKDITASPKKKDIVPEGWELFEKRGAWCTRSPMGTLAKHASKVDAMGYMNG